MNGAMNDIKRVYDMLADDKSREVFGNMLQYTLNGDIGIFSKQAREIARRFCVIGESVIRFIHIPSILVEDILRTDGQYFWPSGEKYEICREIRQFAHRFSGQPIVYGAGTEFKNAIQILELSGIASFDMFENSANKNVLKIKSIWDNDPSKQGCQILASEIVKPFSDDDQESPIFIATSKVFDIIFDFLIGHGIDKNRIFPRSFAQYYSSIQFHENLFYYYDLEEYFDRNLVKFPDNGENEVFVDCGACRLETSLRFLRHAPKTKAIYAFEPDGMHIPYIYQAIEKNKLENVHFFEAAVSNQNGIMRFAGSENRVFAGGVLDSVNGNKDVAVNRIDDVIHEKVTFIKMDIEGAELDALYGAEKTIIRDKPRLAICVYHSVNDIVDIPLYIHRLVPEYRLYMRHHSSANDSTILYAIP
jgi:FkbM family methyltransferase